MKNSKAFLYIGLILYLSSFILSSIYQLFYDKSSSSQDLLYNFFIEFPAIVFIVLAVVLAPIIEEFIFRGWITKNRILTIISFIGMVVFSYMALNIYAAILIFVILLYVNFKIASDKKVLVFVIVNSLIFTLAHKTEFQFDFFALFALTQILGLSFLINYFGLKYGFRYSILVHIINNFIAVVVFSFLLNNKSLEIKENNYQVNIERDYSLFSKKGQKISRFCVSLIYGNKNIPDTIVYKEKIKNIVKYNINYQGEYGDNIKYDIFNKIVEEFNLKLDTVYENPYVFSVIDSIKFYNNQSKTKKDSYDIDFMQIDHFIDQIRSLYKIPLIKNINEKVEFVYVDRSKILKYQMSKTEKENAEIFINKFVDETGILLKYDTTRLVTVINISD